MQVIETVQSREKMLAMSEALMLGSLRQHELAEVSELLNVQLQREINERKWTSTTDMPGDHAGCFRIIFA